MVSPSSARTPGQNTLFFAAFLANLLGGGSAMARPASSADAEGVARPGLRVEKGPYLQNLGSTGVTIKFELGAPDTARVQVFAAGADEKATPIAEARDESRSFHAVRVSGLKPSTAYDYRVVVGNSASATGHFATAPEDTRPFRFLLYGDNRSNPDIHRGVVQAMAAVPSDFIVNTGDLVAAGNDPEEWKTFFSIENDLLRDRCVFAAVGNHELTRGDASGEVAFLRYFAPGESATKGHIYSTFRWSNTRFFVLNAMDSWTGEEHLWLRDELDRSQSEPGIVHRMVILHWSPFSSGRHGDNVAMHKAGALETLRKRKVDLILAGHDHAYERGEGEGLKYVISGGGGAPLYKRDHNEPATRVFESAYHFVEIAVDGDHVSLTARRPSGAVIETCGFRGESSWDCDKSPDPPKVDLVPPASAPPRAGCRCDLTGAQGGGASGLAIAAVVLGALARRRRQR